ncbi:MAG: hypothetical protein ACHQ50_09625 [Fimbriimonadales bacterium]
MIEIVLLHHGSQTVEVTLDPRHEPAVTAKLGGKVIWRGIHRDYKPWKIAVADVDGDRSEDFIVALFKHTRHSPHRLHTLFVFGFDGTTVYPKWRGSRLARDFVDFVFARGKNGDKLLTLDRLLDGRFALSCYRWSGFGFRKQWERGDWKQARLKAGVSDSMTVVTEGGSVKISIGQP